MKKYIIGVDGGGTSTQAALFDQNKTIIKESSSGFCNFNVDASLSVKHVFEAIDMIFSDVRKEEVESIILGLSGVMSYLDKDQFLKKLEETYLTKVFIVNDAYLGLFSVKKDYPGDTLLILAGTGSVLYLQSGDNMTMIGGYGQLLGDEGSGYHLAITFLKKMIAEAESMKRPRSSFKKVLKHLKLKDYTMIKDYVYQHHKNEIASLSKYLSELAVKDAFVQKLLKEEGKYLAFQAENALKRASLERPILVGLRGSFLLNAPFVKEELIERMNQLGYQLIWDEDNLEPIYGAYYIEQKQKKENTKW